MLNANVIRVNKVFQKFCLTILRSIISYMNREKYLRRIGVKKTDITADLQNLKFLQRQHLLYVPFEN